MTSTVDEQQAVLERHRKWLTSPPGYEASEAHTAAHALASALADALTRNERIARARSRNAGFSELYRKKALQYKAQLQEAQRTNPFILILAGFGFGVLFAVAISRVYP